MSVPPIVDAHLDLAENATLFGHDLRLGLAAARAERPQATVSLPGLRRGGIAVVFATVTPGFLVADVGTDFEPRAALYETPQEAEARALAQVSLYEEWAAAGLVRLIRSLADLDHHLELWQADRTPGLVLLMESADPIVEVADLDDWWQRGVRLIGLTYGDTRYGAGVGSGSEVVRRGGLTSAGVALLERMGEYGIAWDISHLAEDGVWQGLELGVGRVCASHANARQLTPSDRHLSDEVIRALAARDGVVGLVLYNKFLDPRWRHDRSIAVTLADQARRHAQHLAEVGGWRYVGIGSDLDGGFGRDQTPTEIDSVADLVRVGGVVPPEVRAAVLGGNWLRFLRTTLPRSS
jgi:membrane dipeptidase